MPKISFLPLLFLNMTMKKTYNLDFGRHPQDNLINLLKGCIPQNHLPVCHGSGIKVVWIVLGGVGRVGWGGMVTHQLPLSISQLCLD